MIKRFIFVSTMTVLGLFFMAASALAAAPITTITTPENGSTVTNMPLVVSGTFSADTTVKKVGVVVCQADTAGVCTASYVQDVNGTLGTAWKALSASRTPSDGKTGTYGLSISDLAPSYYRVAVFAADATTQKGPRAVALVHVRENTDPADPSYITVMWGRSNWQATVGGTTCAVPVGARTLEDNAIDMQVRGLFGVGGVVINRTSETERKCYSGMGTQASWQDMARLRDTYNWKFISQSMNYPDMTTLSADQVYNESAATLPILEAHGHMSAWGAFNYPNDKQNPAVQAIVMQHFAFGRKYDTGKNTRDSVSSYPYTMSTRSINGGKCYNPSLPCNTTKANLGGRTTPVPEIIDILNPGPNDWGVIQLYRLVEGKNGSLGQPMAWDCTSPSWQNRWTSRAEVYCRNSFLEALDGRSQTATVIDPATLAETWGILPQNR